MVKKVSYILLFVNPQCNIVILEGVGLEEFIHCAYTTCITLKQVQNEDTQNMGKSGKHAVFFTIALRAPSCSAFTHVMSVT